MFTFSVKPVPETEGGPGGDAFTVTADSRDVLKWEKADRTGQRSISKMLGNPTLIDSYALAYLAAKRLGKIECTAHAFEDGYLLQLGVEPEPDPTQPAR